VFLPGLRGMERPADLANVRLVSDGE
jgi:hypothetical protein